MIKALETVWRDLKYGVRTLAGTPGFTIVAVLSLALGIGANTAIFTLTNAVFLNPLPVRDAGRVLELFTVIPIGTKRLRRARFDDYSPEAGLDRFSSCRHCIRLRSIEEMQFKLTD